MFSKAQAETGGARGVHGSPLRSAVAKLVRCAPESRIAACEVDAGSTAKPPALATGVLDVHSEPHSHSQFSWTGASPFAGSLMVLMPSGEQITSSSGAGWASRPASIFAIATADREPCSTSNDATTRRTAASQRLCLKAFIQTRPCQTRLSTGMRHVIPCDPVLFIVNLR